MHIYIKPCKCRLFFTVQCLLIGAIQDKWTVIAARRHHCVVMAQQINTVNTSTPISTSTLPIFLKTSRRTASVRQYRPVCCHLQVRASPLRARFARHVVRNTLLKILVYLNELFLTSPIQIASHFISQTNKDHGMGLATGNKPFLHGSTRHCNDIPCRNIFPVEGSRMPGRRNVLHSGSHCILRAHQDASPFWHSLRTPPNGGYTPDPRRHCSASRCHCTSALPTDNVTQVTCLLR